MHDPPLIGAYIALNESDYIGYSIQSLYEVLDRIIVVENANPCAMEFASEEGLSTDGMTELLATMPDPENKIQHIKLGLVPNEGEARQTYLDQIPEYAIVVGTDGDETWMPEDVEEVHHFFRGHSEVEKVNGEQYMLWSDLHHYVVTHTPIDRIFRKLPGLYYPSGNTLMGTGLISPRPMTVLPIPHPPRMVHFGWVRRPIRLYQKVRYTFQYNRFFNTPDPDTYRVHYMPGEDIPWEILLNHHCFTRDVPKDWNIRELPFDLPAPFKTHPFFTLSEDQIFDKKEYQELIAQELQ